MFEFHLNTVTALLRRDPTHVFSCEICDIFKNTYFEESFQEYLFCRKTPIESFLSRDIYVVAFFCRKLHGNCFLFFLHWLKKWWGIIHFFTLLSSRYVVCSATILLPKFLSIKYSKLWLPINRNKYVKPCRALNPDYLQYNCIHYHTHRK